MQTDSVKSYNTRGASHQPAAWLLVTQVCPVYLLDGLVFCVPGVIEGSNLWCKPRVTQAVVSFSSDLPQAGWWILAKSADGDWFLCYWGYLLVWVMVAGFEKKNVSCTASGRWNLFRVISRLGVGYQHTVRLTSWHRLVVWWFQLRAANPEIHVQFREGDYLRLSCCHEICVWNRRGAQSLIMQISSAKSSITGSSPTICICVFPVYLVDK